MDSSPILPIYAPFRKRLFAYGYDSLLTSLAGLLLNWQLGSVAFAQTPEVQQQIDALVSAGLLPAGTTEAQLPNLLGTQLASMFSWHDLVLPLLVSAVYHIYFTASVWQATLGKRFCGIYVTNADGSRLTPLQSAIRHINSGLSMLLGGLPMLTILFTREKLAPHDMLCHTRVVMGRLATSA